MSVRAFLAALLVVGFGLHATDVDVASGSGRGDGRLSIQGGIDEPQGGTASRVTPKETPCPDLTGWVLDPVEVSRPLVDSDDVSCSSALGPGWRLGRAPPPA